MKELGFVESKNTLFILFSAVFLVLGFLLGRVTGHHGPRMHKGHPGFIEVGENVCVSDGEVEVNIEDVMESMTGGQGQDVQIIRRESGDGEVRVEKRIVVVRDENDIP